MKTKEQLKEWWNENKNDIWQKAKTGLIIVCASVGSYKLGKKVCDNDWTCALNIASTAIPNLLVKDYINPSKSQEIIEEVTKKFGKN